MRSKVDKGPAVGGGGGVTLVDCFSGSRVIFRLPKGFLFVGREKSQSEVVPQGRSILHPNKNRVVCR